MTSPFPKGTEESVIYLDEDGKVLPDKEGAVQGETVAEFSDGSTMHTTFSRNGKPPQY